MARSTIQNTSTASPHNDRPSSKPTLRFQIMISPLEHKALSQLAERTHCSRAHIMRQCLRYRLQMDNNHIPMCADGQRCVAPHLHTTTAHEPNP